MEKPTRVPVRRPGFEGYSVPVEELTWRPGGYGIVVVNNRVLMEDQSAFNRFEFPGGGIEIWETFEQGLKREYLEETGLHVQALDFVHLAQTFYQHNDHEGPWATIRVYFTCKVVSGELITGKNMDGWVPTWVPIDVLTPENMPRTSWAAWKAWKQKHLS